MIKLTSLQNEPIIINVDQILFIERHADTIITYVNGLRTRVLEDPETVVELSMRWHQRKWIPIVDQ